LTAEAPVGSVVVPDPNHAHAHSAAAAHESPAIMTVPMWALAIAAAFAGWLAHPFAAYLEPALGSPHEVTASGAAGSWLPHAAIPVVALTLAVSGLLAGAWRYRRGAPAGAPAALAPLARLLERGLYFDAAYEATYRRGLLGAAAAVAWVDRHVVDGAVNLTAALTGAAGEGLRQIQTGRAQDYVYGFLAGILALAAWTYFLTP
jgi:NADH:ubiquinone oxidoreductase subunit 5 (subunit L)/multisubunit Na+/H+ antiporter MnhA subunit